MFGGENKITAKPVFRDHHFCQQ